MVEAQRQGADLDALEVREEQLGGRGPEARAPPVGSGGDPQAVRCEHRAAGEPHVLPEGRGEALTVHAVALLVPAQ